MSVMYEKRCKVCNSQFRNLIEDLHIGGLSPEKVFEYLQNLTDPNQQAVVQAEQIKPSSIRRHIDRHFNLEDGAKIKVAETKNRLEKSRSAFEEGVQATIDKVSHLSHLIEVAMINIQEVETTAGNQKTKHQQIIQYMNTVKSLIESLAKLTGDLKQEGTIDVNFFNDEITIFAELVMRSIRSIDIQLNLMGELEGAFSAEFEKQWSAYQDRRDKIISGDLKVGEGDKMRNVNTFNEGM